MKQALRLTLQSSTTVTAAEGSVPVIGASTQDCRDELPMAINFLRAGHPAVQILYRYMVNEIADVKKLLALLTLKDEKLTLVVEGKENFRVLVLTRSTN